MFRVIKKMLIVLLASIVNSSNHTKCISLSNQNCDIQPALINIHPNVCNQEFHCYSFVVKLDRGLEVVILLMTYLLSYVFQINQKI